MAENSKIEISWTGLREQATQIESKVLPVFREWEDTITGYSNGLSGYSSEFVEQLSAILYQTAKTKIDNASNELTQYINSLNKTADVFEQNENNNIQDTNRTSSAREYYIYNNGME